MIQAAEGHPSLPCPGGFILRKLYSLFLHKSKKKRKKEGGSRVSLYETREPPSFCAVAENEAAADR